MAEPRGSVWGGGGLHTSACACEAAAESHKTEDQSRICSLVPSTAAFCPPSGQGSRVACVCGFGLKLKAIHLFGLFTFN